MKRIPLRAALLAAATLAVLATAVPAHANERHYRHDSRGWYDEHGHRRDFLFRNGHHGYWDNHIWISID